MMMITVFSLIVVSVLVTAGIAVWILNEENKSLIAADEASNRRWNSAVQVRDDRITQLQEQLAAIESDYQQFRQTSINQSHLQSEENKRLREEIANHEKIAAVNVVEIQRLSDNLTAWVEKHDRLTAKASELCEVLRGNS